MPTNTLKHADLELKSDDHLAQETAVHLREHPPLQFMSELLGNLRTLGLEWWSPEGLREDFPAAVRMLALAERADLRQKITTQLTGLKPGMAREMTPDQQADLIEVAFRSGDLDARTFENAFRSDVLAVYLDVRAFWRRFRERMPWDNDTAAHRVIMESLIISCVAPLCTPDESPTPLLTHRDVLIAIDRKTWQTHIPLETRVAIDEALLALEKDEPTKPFHAKHVLAIATPQIISRSIPLPDLQGIVDAAEKAMGFDETIILDEDVVDDPKA